MAGWRPGGLCGPWARLPAVVCLVLAHHLLGSEFITMAFVNAVVPFLLLQRNAPKVLTASEGVVKMDRIPFRTLDGESRHELPQLSASMCWGSSGDEGKPHFHVVARP